MVRPDAARKVGCRALATDRAVGAVDGQQIDLVFAAGAGVGPAGALAALQALKEVVPAIHNLPLREAFAATKPGNDALPIYQRMLRGAVDEWLDEHPSVLERFA